MKTDKDPNRYSKAFGVLILQVIAWVITVSPFFGDYTGSDAAGNGMAKAFAFLFVTAPGIAFIFLINLYFVFKKSLGRWYKVVFAVNLLGLLIVNSLVNW